MRELSKKKKDILHRDGRGMGIGRTLSFNNAFIDAFTLNTASKVRKSLNSIHVLYCIFIIENIKIVYEITANDGKRNVKRMVRNRSFTLSRLCSESNQTKCSLAISIIYPV